MKTIKISTQIKIVALIIYIFTLLSTVNGKSFHVTTTGTSTGDGSIEKPLSLTAALAHPAMIQPRDTILIHEGTYVGAFTSNLKGSAGGKIYVLPYNNETVILDGNLGRASGPVLTINGSDTFYSGLIVLNSDTKRISTQSGSSPTDIYTKTGIDIFGSNVNVVNCIIKDNIGSGIGLWKTAINTEVAGCIIYNNGFQGTDRGHGHGIYTQNETDTKQIRENIIFNGFAYGIHAYTEKGSITGYNINGNILFNNGILSSGKNLKSNILMGGLIPADKITVTNNHVFHNLEFGNKNLELGYSDDISNKNTTVSNNTISGGAPSVTIVNWENINFNNNKIYGNYQYFSMLVPTGVSTANYQWNNNTYYLGNTQKPFNGLSFSEWKTKYSIDNNSTLINSAPTQNVIDIRANPYIQGRANIMIYNWQKLENTSIDVSSILTQGQKFWIYDIQNLIGNALVEGEWNGEKINVPLTSTTIEQPNGTVPSAPTHTPKEFVTLLIKTNTNNFKTEDISEFKLLGYYPNPTESIVTVEFASTEEVETTILISDISGNTINKYPITSSIGKNTINIELVNIENGIYLITIFQGDKKFSFKIMKSVYGLK